MCICIKTNVLPYIAINNKTLLTDIDNRPYITANKTSLSLFSKSMHATSAHGYKELTFTRIDLSPREKVFQLQPGE